VTAWFRSEPTPATSKKSDDHFWLPFAHIWTVRGDKPARVNMHNDTAKMLEAMEG